jgi:hypothetical protein
VGWLLVNPCSYPNECPSADIIWYFDFDHFVSNAVIDDYIENSAAVPVHSLRTIHRSEAQ